MASSFHNLLMSSSLPVANELTIWLDNCSYQNKNYHVMRPFLLPSTKRDPLFQSVALKYSFSGHCFMAATSCHYPSFLSRLACLAWETLKVQWRGVTRTARCTLNFSAFWQFPEGRSCHRIGRSKITISIYRCCRLSKCKCNTDYCLLVQTDISS